MTKPSHNGVITRPPLPMLTAIEYFAGIGLMRMGLEPLGWRVVYANDIEEQKFEMYAAFFNDAKEHYVVDDVFNLNAIDVPPALLATCSFPCIDLSLAGNMNGIDGKHSSAFWGFIRILEEQGNAAPPLVLVENVPGWLSSNNGADFRVTVSALNKLGYACDVFILDALRFVPQSRKRVFLVGSKMQEPLVNLAPLLARPATLTSARLKQAIADNNDLHWMHVDIPTPPPMKKSGLSKIIEDMDEVDGRWWSEQETQRHLDMMAPAHRERVNELIERDDFSYRTFYRRRRHGQQRAEVRRDDVAGCLRTAIGGSSKQSVLKAGRGTIKMRTMTPREYARLQGVPESFPIAVDGNQALTGFGDAVCVPAIKWIAENVLSQLVEEIPSPVRTKMSSTQRVKTV